MDDDAVPDDDTDDVDLIVSHQLGHDPSRNLDGDRPRDERTIDLVRPGPAVRPNGGPADRENSVERERDRVQRAA